MLPMLLFLIDKAVSGIDSRTFFLDESSFESVTEYIAGGYGLSYYDRVL